MALIYEMLLIFSKNETGKKWIILETILLSVKYKISKDSMKELREKEREK